MFGKLANKKTYIVAGLSAIGAVAGYLTGDLALHDAVQLLVTAILGATVRHGIATK